MFCSFFSSLFVSVLTIVDVCANPLPPPPTGFSVSISRSFRHRPSVNSSSLQACDLSRIARECKSLGSKYRDVDQNFNNTIGLGPIFDTEADPERPFIQPVLGQTHSTMSLTDYVPDGWLDLMYYGPVNVGTPPREMTVDIDTGSADLWFPKKLFKHSKSSTLKKSDEDFDVCYGSGEVSGKLWQDTVSIGGLVVDGQHFGAVSDFSGDFNDLPNDGLLGLAFGSIAQCGKPTFFENLRAKRKISSSMFSVHLARRPDRDNDDSSVCFGCIDPLKTLGSTIYIPVICEAYWAVSMNAMVLTANKTVLRLPTSIRAIIDTGTSLIYLPQADVVKFYAAIPGSRHGLQADTEFYTFPCSAAFDIQFEFAGARFSINLADFNLGKLNEDSSDCVGGILPLSNDFPPDLAIIGDEFLKSWYSTYDYTGGPKGGARVGFSPSINNAR